MHYNQFFHNILWKYFNITKIHKEISEEYADNKAQNVTIVGYPKCDEYLDVNYKPKDVWKVEDRAVKRIIWTPHQSIEDNEKELGYSCFLLNYQNMLDLAQQYKGKIQIAFKPHPILKQKHTCILNGDRKKQINTIKLGKILEYSAGIRRLY